MELLFGGLRVFDDLIAGEAHGLPAGEEQLRVAAAVVVECRARVVGGVAVGFDDQAVVGPDEVAGVGLDGVVDLWSREVGVVADFQERFFEIVDGCRAPGLVVLQGDEGGGSAVAVGEFDGCVEVLDLGFVDEPLQLSGGQDVGEVGDRARRGGRWDAATNGDVLERQVARAVQIDSRLALSSAANWCRDVDQRAIAGTHCPQMRRAAETEHGAPPAREQRGHPAPLQAQDRVAKGVDAAMDAKQPSLLHTPVDHPHVDPGFDELRAANDTPLPASELRDDAIQMGWCSLTA